MFSKRLRWYPLFESVEDLHALFAQKQCVVYRNMFGEYLLIKNKDEVLAFSNNCPHQNKPLNDCWIEDNSIVCPFHQYHYNLEDGRGHGMYIEKYPLKTDEKGVFIGVEKWSVF